MVRGRVRNSKHPSVWAAVPLVATFLGAGTAPLRAQGFLEEFSYEGLGFSGIGLDVGAVASDRLATEIIGSLRVDYGFIAPRVRTLIGVSYFRSRFTDSEIGDFEDRLRGIVTDPTADFSIDVGEVTWTNVAVDLDLQYLFANNETVIPYAGVGLGVHVRDASGSAIAGTFVEDALETIAAVLNVTAGFEIGITPRLRFTADGRGMFSSGLIAVSVRGGFMLRFPRSAE